MAALYHGVIPALRLANLSALAAALREIHEVGFKARELRARPAQVSSMLLELQALGLAAGMSSIGPLVYVIIGTDDGALTRIKAVSEHYSARMLTLTCGRNDGFQVRPGQNT